jgi:competence protein ComEC
VSPWLGVAWRFAALGGLALGLALAPAHPAAPAPPPLLLGLAAVLALARPRGAAALGWLALVAAVAALAGLTAGAARLAAIDARALAPPAGQPVDARGTVTTTPRVVQGATRFVLAVDEGRIVVEDSAATEVDQGDVVRVSGTAREPAPWEADQTAREGAARMLVADSVAATGAVRGGPWGALDGIRRRAEAALERGTPALPAALLRGFVLGQDDRIPEPVRDEFRRSGLAHVLAVSGQNVMLLALLAAPILALGGVPLRARLIALVAVIAVYVPVAGAGASIQRAGVMGAAGLVAALAGRPRARWYALLLAAAATLALNPRATGDIGWQLSFAAVAGLLVLARPLAQLLGGRAPGPARRLLAEGAAMTLAASLATAPLAAHHFGTVSLTAIPANLLALPAIAPAMWLGMLAGALGQLPAAPVEPLTALGGLCAGFIGWVAHVLGGERAQLEIAEPGLVAAIATSTMLLVAARLGCTALSRRADLRPRPRGRSRRTVAIALAAGLALALLAGPGRRSSDRLAKGPPPALTLRVLDVGQGDAILLEPRGASPVLVDTGPPGGGAASRLDDLGVDHLGALAVTHDQLDHAGALGEILAAVAVDRLIVGPGAAPAYCRSAACPPARRVASGDVIRAGRLRLDVLWPPEAPGNEDADPNARSLVLHGRIGSFDALLTGDAEAEAAPVDAGLVELLKIAHHGSADPGLPALLDRASPDLAAISVGSENPYGHPAPETLGALTEAGVPVLRTDTAGELVIEVRDDGWLVG